MAKILSVLLTGFGPFRGITENPTESIATQLNGTHLGSVRVKSLVLPVAISKAFIESTNACDSSTTAILSLGVSSKIDCIHIEKRGQNHFKSDHGDIEGNGKGAWIIESNGPTHRSSTFPYQLIHEALKTAGFQNQISDDAGKYLCNWLYYKLLGKDIPVLFVHVPQVSKAWPLERLIEATKIILLSVGDASQSSSRSEPIGYRA